MVRGKVQLKWIENKINRQVTFSKRRSGLLNKAHEISVLCDVEVALIVFSTNGKLYEYSTDSGMDRILERYERYSYADRKLVPTDPGSQANLSLECTKLKAKVDILQKYQRHLMGENIENLCIKELQNLEQQIDSSLKQIRSRKNQLMHESISDLEKKERSLHEQNNKLGKKLKEREKELPHQVPWEQPSPYQNPQTFFLTHSLPTLNLGGNYRVRNKLVEDEEPPRPRPTILMPPWTLVDDEVPPQPHPTISMPPWMLTGVEDKMPPQPCPAILMPPWMLT